MLGLVMRAGAVISVIATVTIAYGFWLLAFSHPPIF
jgi:hypothetical protein